MKLSLITELKFNRAVKRVRPLLRQLPRRKARHSLRVGQSLKQAGAGKHGVYAGLLHDYLERGGDVETLQAHLDQLGLSPKVMKVIQSLSVDEHNHAETNNQPLEHLKQIMDQIRDSELINLIVLTKLGDRNDNLRKRLRAGKLGKNYRQKSIDLYSYLIKQYSGELKPLRKLMAKFEQLIQ